MSIDIETPFEDLIVLLKLKNKNISFICSFPQDLLLVYEFWNKKFWIRYPSIIGPWFRFPTPKLGLSCILEWLECVGSENWQFLMSSTIYADVGWVGQKKFKILLT